MTTQHQQWEYNIFKLIGGAQEFEDNEMDDLGKLGWELVSAFKTKAYTFYYFKRPKQWHPINKNNTLNG